MEADLKAPREVTSICPFSANCDHSRCSKRHCYSITSSARASQRRRHGKVSTAWQVHDVLLCSPPGSRTVNTEPLPGSLVTVTSPPIMRASLRESARPSPVPP